MSIDLLRQRVLARLTELRAEKVNNLRRCKPRSALVLDKGAVVESPSCEEIALFAVDTNATIDAIDLTIAAINEEFKKITSPEEPETQTDEDKQQARKPIYG